MTANATLPDDMSAEQAVQFLNTHSTSITIDCDFGGRTAPFPVYVGDPKDDSHPLHHQATWLQSERGGTIPGDVMESFSTLHKIARENDVSLQMLCLYAFGEAKNGGDGGTTESSGDAFALAPPETPEIIKEEVLPESDGASPFQQADADAAAVLAAAAGLAQPSASHQQRVEQSRPDDAAEKPLFPYKQG